MVRDVSGVVFRDVQISGPWGLRSAAARVLAASWSFFQVADIA